MNVTTKVTDKEIQFINDITSTSVVSIRLRGTQCFIESDSGCIRVAVRADGKLYAHAIEKREGAVTPQMQF